jgi:hypothetical protein
LRSILTTVGKNLLCEITKSDLRLHLNHTVNILLRRPHITFYVWNSTTEHLVGNASVLLVLSWFTTPFMNHVPSCLMAKTSHIRPRHVSRSRRFYDKRQALRALLIALSHESESLRTEPSLSIYKPSESRYIPSHHFWLFTIIDISPNTTTSQPKKKNVWDETFRTA